MRYSYKATGRALSMPAGFVIGTCISVGMTLLLSLLLARLVSTEKLEWEQVGYGIMIILLLTSAIGAKITCVMAKRRKLACCMCTGLLYWLALLMITALFFGGQYKGMGVTGLIILCGSTIVCLQELRGERGRKTNLRKNIPSKRA